MPPPPAANFTPPPPTFGNSPATNQFQNTTAPAPPPPAVTYVPPVIPEVRPHWFYFKQDEPASRPHPANLAQQYPPSDDTPPPTYSWIPLSRHDSAQLEEDKNSTQTILTDGGKFEVDLISRQRRAIFWNQDSQVVTRVTWFFRVDGEYKYYPFDEQIADEIEEFYTGTIRQGSYPQRKQLEPGNLLIVHSPDLVIQALENSFNAKR